MKNILGNKEFKQLKEIQLLQESMDFSNKTGFSDSLIGRALNKIFSSVASKAFNLILNKLKVKLEDQYFKGVLIALHKKGIKLAVADKSNSAAISIKLVNIQDQSQILYNDLNTDNNVYYYRFELPKGHTYTQYKTEITSINNSTWTVNGKEKAQIEPITSNMQIVATAENGKSKANYEILVDLEGQSPVKPKVVQAQDTQDAKSIGTGTKYEIMTKHEYSKQFEIIQKFFKQYNEECVEGVNYGLVIKVSEKLHEESQAITKALELIEKVVEKPKGLMKYVDNKDKYLERAKKLEEYSVKFKNIGINAKDKKNVDDEELKRMIKDLMGDTQKGKISAEDSKKYFQEIVSLWKKVENNASDEMKQAYKSAAAALHPDKAKTGNFTDEQRYDIFTRTKKILQNIQESMNINTQYGKFILEKYINDFINICNEAEVQGQTTQTTTDGTTIKDILKNTRKSDRLKDVIAEYGKVPFDKVDEEALMKQFESDPTLRQEATKSVDKEALKELGLRAAWIYGGDKYKDQRNDHYSRVNMTITATDQAKLENNWKKKISKAKSSYMPFFGDDNGNFPQELDPIALINSDETFRKNWNQYTPEQANTKSVNGIDSTFNPPDPARINKLKLKIVEKLNDNQYGIVVFTPSNYSSRLGNDFGLIVLKSETTDPVFHVWKFLGIVNYGKIYEETKDMTDETEIKEVITKYTYRSTNQIDTKLKSDEELRKEISNLYNTFRPSRHSGFKKIANYDADKDKGKKDLATFFIHQDSLGAGSKGNNFLQFNVVKDETGNNRTFLSEVKPNKTSIEFQEVTDSTKGSIVDAKKYQFYFKIEILFQISSSNLDFWEFQIKPEKELAKTKMFTDNQNAITVSTKLKKNKI